MIQHELESNSSEIENAQIHTAESGGHLHWDTELLEPTAFTCVLQGLMILDSDHAATGGCATAGGDIALS